PRPRASEATRTSTTCTPARAWTRSGGSCLAWWRRWRGSMAEAPDSGPLGATPTPQPHAPEGARATDALGAQAPQDGTVVHVAFGDRAAAGDAAGGEAGHAEEAPGPAE